MRRPRCKQKPLNQTWPLFGQQAPAFPADPATTVLDLAPPSSALEALAQGKGLLPDERTRAQPPSARRGCRPTLPSGCARPERFPIGSKSASNGGTLTNADQAAVARTWAAFCLGGSTESQILKVAHVVQRAHTAIRSTPRGQHDLQAAYHAAAGVLHAALPTSVRDRMPLERAVHVVRKLRDEADPWAAIVEGTSELLGWKDHGRTHAATVIRALLEQHKKP